MQTQGYWVLANWLLSDGGQADAEKWALECCDSIVRAQRADGAWAFPDPAWSGRVTTVEGLWASFSLLESYRHTKESRLLEPVLRWDRFFKKHIGFQEYHGALAVNYFAGRADSLVPNNSFSAIRYLARLDQATGVAENADLIDRMLSFLEMTQQASGEFPYELHNPRMQHFQCFQYHGFLLLDILDYFQVTGDQRALPIMSGLASFLVTGVTSSGDVMYQCGVGYRHVNYHAAVTMAALHQYGLHCQTDCPNGLAGELRSKVTLIMDQLIAKQRSDGSFPHSRGDYRLLSDQRAYPRYLAMMLLHFLLAEQTASVPASYASADSTRPTQSFESSQCQTPHSA